MHEFISWTGNGIQLGSAAFWMLQWGAYLIGLKIICTCIVRLVRR